MISLQYAWSLVRERRGLLAVLVLFLCFGTLNVLGVPALMPVDERAHLGYALSVADGELPTIESPLSKQVFGRSKRGYRNYVWVANHPPLYYTLAAPFARYGLATGGVERSVRLVRFMSLALGAIGLVFVHATVRLLTNDERRLALLATFMAAAFPHTIHICSLVHNDSLAILTAVATFYSALLLVQRGYTHARAIALAACASLALLTRFTAVAVVAPAGGIACVALLFSSGQPLRQRIMRSLATGGLLGGGVLVSSGWFYLRNLRLYGDVTGGAALFEKFGRSPRGSALEHALNSELWAQVYRDLWTRFAGGTQIRGLVSALAWLILVAALLGIALHSWRFLRGRPLQWFSAQTLCVAGLAASVALTLVAMFEFYSRGGSLHARYMLPVLWVLALVLAWGISALGRAVGRTAVGLLCFANLLVFNAYFDSIAKKQHSDGVALVNALEQAGVRGAVWVVALVLVALALSLTTFLGESRWARD